MKFFIIPNFVGFGVFFFFGKLVVKILVECREMIKSRFYLGDLVTRIED